MVTAERNDRYRVPEPGDPKFEGEDTGIDDIDEYAGRAALDDSGYWFYLLGKDEEGYGHYLKERDDYAEAAVLDPDQDIIEICEIVYEDEAELRRLQSYVWEHEWEALTEYGAEWLDE